jgi:tetratricopeptide (TPR) repeat protein
MKRLLIAAGLCIVFVILAASLGVPFQARAEGTPTATSAPAVAPVDQPTRAPQEILDEANRAANYADRAVNTVNVMLAFVQVAALIIGAAIAVTTAAGFRTIRDYNAELDKSRTELAKMRTQVQEQADELRLQAGNAIRALTLLQLGEQQLESKNMQSAIRTYLEAFALDPNNRATNYFLGYIYTHERDVEKGIEHLQRALADGGHYPPAEGALAYAMRLKADQMQSAEERRLTYAEAERLFLKALLEDPAVCDIDGESYYAVLGGLYKKQGRIADAITAYQSAEVVTPQNSYPVVNLAMLNFLQGDTSTAENYFKRSAAMAVRSLDGNPFDFWRRFDLTIANLILGHVDDAHKQLKTALHQVHSISPLEVLLGDLERLKNAPHPPASVDELIAQVRQAIDRLRAHEHPETARAQR